MISVWSRPQAHETVVHELLFRESEMGWTQDTSALCRERDVSIYDYDWLLGGDRKSVV